MDEDQEDLSEPGPWTAEEAADAMAVLIHEYGASPERFHQHADARLRSVLRQQGFEQMVELYLVAVRRR